MRLASGASPPGRSPRRTNSTGAVAVRAMDQRFRQDLFPRPVREPITRRPPSGAASTVRRGEGRPGGAPASLPRRACMKRPASARNGWRRAGQPRPRRRAEQMERASNRARATRRAQAPPNRLAVTERNKNRPWRRNRPSARARAGTRDRRGWPPGATQVSLKRPSRRKSGGAETIEGRLRAVDESPSRSGYPPR